MPTKDKFNGSIKKSNNGSKKPLKEGVKRIEPKTDGLDTEQNQQETPRIRIRRAIPTLNLMITSELVEDVKEANIKDLEKRRSPAGELYRAIRLLVNRELVGATRLVPPRNREDFDEEYFIELEKRLVKEAFDFVREILKSEEIQRDVESSSEKPSVLRVPIDLQRLMLNSIQNESPEEIRKEVMKFMMNIHRSAESYLLLVLDLEKVIKEGFSILGDYEDAELVYEDMEELEKSIDEGSPTKELIDEIRERVAGLEWTEVEDEIRNLMKIEDKRELKAKVEEIKDTVRELMEEKLEKFKEKMEELKSKLDSWEEKLKIIRGISYTEEYIEMLTKKKEISIDSEKLKRLSRDAEFNIYITTRPFIIETERRYLGLRNDINTLLGEYEEIIN